MQSQKSSFDGIFFEPAFGPDDTADRIEDLPRLDEYVIIDHVIEIVKQCFINVDHQWGFKHATHMEELFTKPCHPDVAAASMRKLPSSNQSTSSSAI